MLPDKLYLSLKFYKKFGRFPNWKDPKTYNEKLQWLKLYDRRPEYSIMVDKCAVKDYVRLLIGGEYVIPTLGIWNRPEFIDWDELPNQFVLKTTHGGGNEGIVICRDKTSFNKKNAIDILYKNLKKDLYEIHREWPYKNVEHKVIAEKYLEEAGKTSLNDYKVMCFEGKAKLIELHVGRFTDNHTQDFYDREWNLTDITQGSYGGNNSIATPKPALLDEMIRLSEILAKGIPHVRVDWYIVNNQLYFGELTFFDASGLDNFIPEKYNYILGDWIKLPQKTK